MLISILLILFSSVDFIAQDENDLSELNCERITLSIEKSTESNGLTTVDVTVKNAKEPILYLFFENDNTPLFNSREEMEKNIKSGLKKGSYYCKILDANRCTAEISFDVD